MESIGKILEWLTKYGIIDIFFGVGIIAYIREKLKKRVVKSIDGIEILPRMEPLDGFFDIMIKNSSRDPFYIYRVRFKPGYFTSKADRKTVSSFLLSLVLMRWIDDRMPNFLEPRNTEGEYLLVGNTKDLIEAESVFLEPKEEASFPLGFEEGDLTFSKDKNVWQEVLRKKESGILRFHFVHGSDAGIFETQL